MSWLPTSAVWTHPGQPRAAHFSTGRMSPWNSSVANDGYCTDLGKGANSHATLASWDSVAFGIWGPSLFHRKARATSKVHNPHHSRPPHHILPRQQFIDDVQSWAHPMWDWKYLIASGNQTWQWKIPELNEGFKKKITYISMVHFPKKSCLILVVFSYSSYSKLN